MTSAFPGFVHVNPDMSTVLPRRTVSVELLANVITQQTPFFTLPLLSAAAVS